MRQTTLFGIPEAGPRDQLHFDIAAPETQATFTGMFRDALRAIARCDQVKFDHWSESPRFGRFSLVAHFLNLTGEERRYYQPELLQWQRAERHAERVNRELLGLDYRVTPLGHVRTARFATRRGKGKVQILDVDSLKEAR